MYNASNARHDDGMMMAWLPGVRVRARIMPCVFPGVFFHSRVAGTCPVSTDVTMRVNMWISDTISTVAKSYLLVKVCIDGSRSRGVGYRVYLLVPKVLVESPYIMVTERCSIPFPADKLSLSALALPVEAPLVCLKALLSFRLRLVRRRTLLQPGVSYTLRKPRREVVAIRESNLTHALASSITQLLYSYICCCCLTSTLVKHLESVVTQRCWSPRKIRKPNEIKIRLGSTTLSRPKTHDTKKAHK